MAAKVPDDDGSRFIDGSPLLLAAASRLRYFTLRDLAAHAGVPVETARSFLRRSDVVERIQGGARPARKRPGPPEARWQIIPARRAELADQVTAFARVVTEPPGNVAGMASGPSFLELLHGSLTSLTGPEAELNPAPRARELAMATRYLSAAQAELDERRALALPVMPEDEQAIAEAQQTLMQLQRATTAQPAPGGLLEPLDDMSRREFATFLQNWLDSRPPQPPALEEEVAAELLARADPPALIDRLLQEASCLLPAHAAFAPAVTLLRARYGWTKPWLERFVDALGERLAATATPAAIHQLPALAVLAATFDARRLADGLARTLLARQADHLGRELRRICLFALARLARPIPPDSVQPAKEAAAACYILFTLGRDSDDDLPALAPAVLAAPMVDTAAVLIRLGRLAFGKNGLEDRFSSWIDETAMLRNVALVLQRGGFESLRRHLKNLIDAPQAKALLMALKRTGAIDWREGQARGEMLLRLGETVHAALDDVELPMATVDGLGDDTFEHARAMLSEYALSPPPVAQSTVPENRGILERLAERTERRRPHLRMVGS